MHEDAVTGLFALSAKIRGRVRDVMDAPNFERLRQFTTEEQADDFSMTVLHADGLDPRWVGEAMLRQTTTTYAEACTALLAGGGTPVYGIMEPHHQSCYRAFHSRAFAAYLDAGGVGTTPVTPIVTFDRFSFDEGRDRRAID